MGETKKGSPSFLSSCETYFLDALDPDVAAAEQAVQLIAFRRVAPVERDAALSSVANGKVETGSIVGSKRWKLSRTSTLGRLQPQHVGPEFGEHAPAIRALLVGHIENPQTFE